LCLKGHGSVEAVYLNKNLLTDRTQKFIVDKPIDCGDYVSLLQEIK
jgi:hypothetical protein